jgi:hypothetical protein
MTEADDAWLDEVVTDEAKQDPDWREKAKSCRGSFTTEGAVQVAEQVPRCGEPASGAPQSLSDLSVQWPPDRDTA